MCASGGGGGGGSIVMCVSDGGGTGRTIVAEHRLKCFRHQYATKTTSAAVRTVAIGRRTRHAVRSSPVVEVVVVVVGISYFHKSCKTRPS